MNTTLKINKGEYILTKSLDTRSIQIKLIVDYTNKKYSFELQNTNDVNHVEFENIKNYLEDFAKRMIESKSDRNFYENTK